MLTNCASLDSTISPQKNIAKYYWGGAWKLIPTLVALLAQDVIRSKSQDDLRGFEIFGAILLRNCSAMEAFQRKKIVRPENIMFGKISYFLRNSSVFMKIFQPCPRDPEIPCDLKANAKNPKIPGAPVKMF